MKEVLPVGLPTALARERPRTDFLLDWRVPSPLPCLLNEKSAGCKITFQTEG